MALDKLVDSTQLDADLTSVANAIRTKGGTSGSLAFPAGFVSAVGAIPTGVTPTGTKQISITQNGTTTEDVTNYASAEITVSVPTGGGGNEVVTGTFSPASNLREITLTDCVGKQNLLIRAANTVSAAPVARTHCFDLFIGGVCKLAGSSNSSGSSWSVAMTFDQAAGNTNTVTYDPTTGTVKIIGGTSANYAGYYAAGMTYQYVAW